MSNNKNKKSGFTILIAVITAGILLIVAMTIGGIAIKEKILAGATRDSQIAFYAADSVMECTLYWDQKKGVFAPIDLLGNHPTVAISIGCNNDASTDPNINVDAPIEIEVSPTKVVYSYSYMIPNLPLAGGGTTCATARITKSTEKTNLGRPGKTYTTIDAYGYNTCEPSLRRYQYGITTTY